MNKRTLGRAIRAAMRAAYVAGYMGERSPAERLVADIAARFQLDGWGQRKAHNVVDARYMFGRWDRQDAQTVARQEREAAHS